MIDLYQLYHSEPRSWIATLSSSLTLATAILAIVPSPSSIGTVSSFYTSSPYFLNQSLYKTSLSTLNCFTKKQKGTKSIKISIKFPMKVPIDG